jgi:hypothetical protein
MGWRVGRGREEREGEITKAHDTTFWSDGYGHYLDGGDGFMDVHTCQNLAI